MRGFEILQKIYDSGIKASISFWEDEFEWSFCAGAGRGEIVYSGRAETIFLAIEDMTEVICTEYPFSEFTKEYEQWREEYEQGGE